MFDLASYLKERKSIIDAALDDEMPGEDTSPAILHKAMRYSVFSGGKRLRPIMCLGAAEAVGASAQAAILPSLAIELLHTYTLIHDDLPCMDDDDFRRGKPTCHVAFGEANAVLAGDALQALAFDVLARALVPPPYPPNQLVAELAHAAGSHGVVGGQIEDIGVDNRNPTIDIVEYIHLHKTADLFRAAARMGGIAGGAGKEELWALTEYGINMGLAFQIADDLLDAAGTDDEKREKTTCLSVYSPEKARQRAEDLVDKTISAIGKLDKTRTEPLIAIAKYAIERKY